MSRNPVEVAGRLRFLANRDTRRTGELARELQSVICQWSQPICRSTKSRSDEFDGVSRDHLARDSCRLARVFARPPLPTPNPFNDEIKELPIKVFR